MAGIEIRTAQNVIIEYEAASLRQRGLSVFIDVVIVLSIYFFAFLTGIAWSSWIPDGLMESAMESLIIIFSPITGFLVYVFLFELLTKGQTPGKRIMGLRVVRLDGREPEPLDYLLRTVFHIPDTLMSGGILAAILIGSTLGRQRLGDLAANTTVICKRPGHRLYIKDILRIETTDVYTPKFPEVRQLSEEDMLLVKHVLTRLQRFNNEAHRKAVDMIVKNLCSKLGIPEPQRDKVTFLKTLVKDYIVLTR